MTTAPDRLARAFELVKADLAALWLRHNDSHASPAKVDEMLRALTDEQLTAQLNAHLAKMEAPNAR